jgi:hypothetical protein
LVPPRPKPSRHWPLTGSLSRTLVAVTAPVESAPPAAVTHRPTFSADEVVACSLVIFVDASTVTLRFVVDPLEPGCRAAITIVDPDTDETVPFANAGRP